ncbi:MAG: phosphatidate cytidylyltransferase [Flavisolibacter sp.]
MAFNWQTFKTRALTAVIFVVVMMAGLLYNRWSFFLLFSLVHFGAWIEYQKLVSCFNPEYRKIIPAHRYGIMLAGWCILFFFTNDTLALGTVTLTQIGLWLGIVFMIILPVIMVLESRSIFLKNIFYSLFGLLYISLSLALLVNLRSKWDESLYQLSLTMPLLVVFSVWINDTMAYIVGSIIGKTPLSKISPKKTWEGTIGGVILTILVIGLLAYFTGRLPVIHAAILSGLAAVTGTFGDLFESKIKRLAGVKDSGAIMPGHGGFLDRFDSILFASVAVWFYAEWFIH